MLAGTIRLILALYFLYVRFLPAIAIFEIRTLVDEETHELKRPGMV